MPGGIPKFNLAQLVHDECEELRKWKEEWEPLINNYLAYGQGGATFKEAQLLDKLSKAETRIEALEYELAHSLFEKE